MTPYLTTIRHIPRPRPMTDLTHYTSITRTLLSGERSVSTFTINTDAKTQQVTICVTFNPEVHRPPGIYTFRTTDTHEASLREFERMLNEVIPHPGNNT